MKNIVLFTGLIFLLLIYSCNKHKDLEPCKEMKYAPQEFLDYWLVPTGSWYIYKLDTTAEIYDTLTAFGSAITNDQDPNFNEYGALCASQYGLTLQHSNIEYFRYSDSTVLDKAAYESFYTDYGSGANAWGIYHFAQSGSVRSYNLMYVYPFMPGKTIGWNNYVGIDSFSSSVGKFDSVIQLVSNFPILEAKKGKYFKEMYIAKNVGIVKVVYTNGEVWNLIDYKIKQ